LGFTAARMLVQKTPAICAMPRIVAFSSAEQCRHELSHRKHDPGTLGRQTGAKKVLTLAELMTLNPVRVKARFSAS
jgi:hypothetical protein